MKNDFMARAALIIAEVRNRTGIEEIDLEVLEVILQDELNEYYDEGYYSGYYIGRSDGYSKGYSDGYEDCSSEGYE